jgi:hypothetical protein
MMRSVRICVNLARGILLLACFLLVRPALAQDAPCSAEIALRELPSLQFVVDAEEHRLQRSQFAESDLNGWIEAELLLHQLRFNHLAPGVGLAFDLLYIRAEVLDELGQPLPEYSYTFPSESECFLLSIFPGGSTKFFDLSKKLQKLDRRRRMRIRVFVPDHS